MTHDEKLLKISAFILEAAKKHLLKKAVLSKCTDKTVQKTVLSEKVISKQACIQAETFHKDNKATHKNFQISELNVEQLAAFADNYMQINLILDGAECEYKRSASGKTVIINEKKVESFLAISSEKKEPLASLNDRQKKYILSGDEPFLKLLGVSDSNGRIHDKKQSKFRQINRFLEIIRDCEDHLPSDSIRICDLCCGKSYLSFAAYHYFSVIKGMSVRMTGVDLKADVIEHCSAVANELGFTGLEFICQDINVYAPEDKPDLVISLHACDIATDMVLTNAARWQTDVILSTPCCHHELNHNINCKELSFITEHSMLRQKLCDAATDALRLCRLEACGYVTSTLELIDPNETPKNVMLRAFRNKRFNADSSEARAAMERYLAAKAFLCGDNDTSALHF